jgi:succinate dehydrogenase hydrophobic anchor subunit
MGLQVVIEDYIPSKGTRIALVIATKLFSATLATAGVLAVATILFRV